MKDKKAFIFVIILGIFILAIVLLFFLHINKQNKTYEYNKNYIKTYLSEKYPGYKIVGKRYETSDGFLYSTYSEIESDSLKNNVVCYISLINEKTKMKITIPFFHPKNGKYTDSQYGRKNIKNMVNEYIDYYILIQKISKKYNIEIEVADAEFSEADNSDIYNLTIYINNKNNNKENIENFVDDTKNINTSLYINYINYIVSNDDIFIMLDPYTESNKYYINGIIKERMNMNVKNVEENDDYDFYMLSYGAEDNYARKIEGYYKLEK